MARTIFKADLFEDDHIFKIIFLDVYNVKFYIIQDLLFCNLVFELKLWNNARLITYFRKLVFRQSYQNTKNRLRDFHFHVFRFCLSCLAQQNKLFCNILVTWSPKTTKGQVTKMG